MEGLGGRVADRRHLVAVPLVPRVGEYDELNETLTTARASLPIGEVVAASRVLGDTVGKGAV